MFSVTTNLIGDIVGALFSLVSWIIEDFVMEIAGFLARAVYQIIVMVPLQVINLLVAAFRFFASGMMSIIFDIRFFNNGSFIENNFSLLSPFGYVVVFMFVISMMVFFTNFLLTFANRSPVDASGSPVSAQARKFTYLKWPAIMIIFLILGPTVLVLCDLFIGFLLNRVKGQQTFPGLSQQEIYGVSALITNLNSYKTSLGTYLTTDLASLDNISLQYITLLQKIDSGPLVFNPETYSDSDILYLKSWIGNDELFSAITTNGTVTALSSLLTKYHYAFTEINNTYNNILGQQITEATNVLRQLTVGQKLNTAQVNSLTSLVETIRGMKTNIRSLYDATKRISQSSININKAFEVIQLCMNNSGNLINANTDAVLSAAVGINGAGTMADNLIDIGNSSLTLTQSPTITRADFNTTFNSMEDTNGPYNSIFFNYTSYYNNIIDGTTNNTSLYTYIKKADRNTAVVIADDQLVKTIYQAITGDRAENWDDTSRCYWLDHDSNFVQWIFGTLSVFGMIMITWNFTSAALKRTFFLIAYWMVGFMYLANGISNQKAVSGWLKMFIGKWWCIFVLYLLFEMVSVIMPIIIAGTVNGLQNNKTFMYGEINFLVSIGTVFIFETGYTSLYSIWNKYQGTFGTQEEAFNPQQSFMMTQGKQMYESAKGGVVGVYNAVTAVPRKIKNTYKNIVDSKKWRRDVKGQKEARQKSSLNYRQNRTNFGDKANKDGLNQNSGEAIRDSKKNTGRQMSRSSFYGTWSLGKKDPEPKKDDTKKDEGKK